MSTVRRILAGLALALPLLAGEGSMANGGLHPVSFRALPGWRQADHRLALAAFARSCRAMFTPGYTWRKAAFGGNPADWRAVCQAALRLPQKVSRTAARAFFERHFVPFSPLPTRRPAGLFTGYYEPEVEASLKRHGPYQVPLHGRPADLVRLKPKDAARLGVAFGRYVNGRARPYFTREEIERGALDGRGLEIAWLKSPVDRFFMQIQGSGRLRLDDGRVARVAFAGKTGHPFTPVGRLLVERGILPKEGVSMQSIRAWMARHPEEARRLMWENKSYVFFRIVELPDNRLGAYGAQGVQLTPMTSLAVDHRYWPYGAPVWLETRIPAPRGGERPFRRLMVAQDTGTAIRGVVRGDIYFGFGDAAGALAGRMKAPGYMAVLLPRAVARKVAAGRKAKRSRGRKRTNWRARAR